MQDRSHDLEGELPSGPGLAEEDEDHDCLSYCTHCGYEESTEEEVGKKRVAVGEDAVEDEGNVEPEFGEDVKGTCSAQLASEP